jgi:hypothetical protein
VPRIARISGEIAPTMRQDTVAESIGSVGLASRCCRDVPFSALDLRPEMMLSAISLRLPALSFFVVRPTGSGEASRGPFSKHGTFKLRSHHAPSRSRNVEVVVIERKPART